VLQAAAGVLADALRSIIEVAKSASIAAIFAGVAAGDAMLERAILTDTPPFDSLCVQALDLLHEEVGEEETSKSESQPNYRAACVFESELLASLLLAVASDSLQAVFLELVQLDHLVNKHHEFEDQVANQE